MAVILLALWEPSTTHTTIVVIQSQKAGHHTRKAEERKTQKGKTHSVSPMENFVMSSEGSENIFFLNLINLRGRWIIKSDFCENPKLTALHLDTRNMKKGLSYGQENGQQLHLFSLLY